MGEDCVTKPPRVAPGRRLSRRKRLAFLAVTALFFVSAIEITLRATDALGLRYAVIMRDVLRETLTLSDHQELLWTHQPGRDFHLFAGFRARINRFGVRDEEFPAVKTETDRFVLCLGDSFTFGVGQNEPYPRLLQTTLHERLGARRVRVFNAGVMGYNTRQSDAMRRHLEATLGYRFDAVCFQPCSNDSIDWPDDTPAAEVFAEHMSGDTTAWARRVASVSYEVLPYTTALVSHGYRVGSFDPTPQPLRMTIPEFQLGGRNLEALERMARECRLQGQPFVVFSWPPHPQYEEFAKIHGARHVGIEGDPGVVYTNSPGEGHGNERFHRRVADELADILVPLLTDGGRANTAGGASPPR